MAPNRPGPGPLPGLVAATYNVHHWVGTDGRYDPGRTLGVVRELDAALVGLQECALATDGAPAGHAPHVTEAYLAGQTGMQPVVGPLLLRDGRNFGNLFLSRLPILRVQRHDLSLPRREPRGVLDVVVQAEDGPLRVLVTHFGLRHRERRLQARQVMAIVADGPAAPVLLMGDLNQWFPLSGALTPIFRWFGPSPLRRSFPSRWPLLPLDRMWLGPAGRLESVRAHRSPAARLASDHLPVRARVALPGP